MNVGIDLGTTYSVISFVNEQGIPTLFPDFHDSNLHRTPSVAHIGERGCLVGQVLESLLEDDPSLSTARFVKLELAENGVVYTDHEGRSWTAEEISALILRKVIRDANGFASEEVDAAVITVPAQFSEAERRATKRAGLLAGLKEVIIAEEPIAAAYYYGQSKRQDDSTLMVFDLGGGTFDATILQAAPDGLFVLASEGTRVGGKDFDAEIVQVAAETFQAQHGFDPLDDPVAGVQLRRFAEIAKIKLSQPGRDRVKSSLLLAGKPFEFFMTGSQLDALVEPFVRQTLQVCEGCLGEAMLDWSGMDCVLLTGGSSRMPIVRRYLEEASGLPGDKIILDKPDMAVSYGAALMASELLSRAESGSRGQSYRQAASHDLCLRSFDPDTGGPVLYPIIEKNSALPAEVVVDCGTSRPQQERIDFDFVQVRDGGHECRDLGRFVFGPLTPSEERFSVSLSVSYDAEGAVEVCASDSRNGHELRRILEDRERADQNLLKQGGQLIQSLPLNA